MGSSTAPERDSEGHEIVRNSGLPVDDNYRVRHTAIFNFEIPFNTQGDEEQHVLWKIPQLQYNQADCLSVMTGVNFKASGGSDDDEVSFCVVDQDGVGVELGLYDQATFDFLKSQNPEGSWVELDSFAKDFLVHPGNLQEIREYKSDIYAGLYISACYKNKSTTQNAHFRCNLYRYIVTG